MKFFIISLTLLGAVAADVKHLNNMYLPPLMTKLAHKHVEYGQQSQEIPQVSLSFGAPVEITDNSVIEQVDNNNQEQQYLSGNINIDGLNYGPGIGGEIQSHVEENTYYTGATAVRQPEVPTAQIETEEKEIYTGLEYKPVPADSATTSTSTTISAETSVPAPGSDAFTQQQATYYTSLSQQQQQEAAAPVAEGALQETEKKFFTGLTPPDQRGSFGSTSTSTTTFVEQGSQEPERKYYNGLVAPSQGDSSGSTSTSTTTVVEQVPQEPERQYYTGLITPTEGDSSASISSSTITHVDQVPQEPERQYYTGLIAPNQGSAASVSTATKINSEGSGSNDFAQQQAAYLAQQSLNQEAGLIYNNAHESAGSIDTTSTTATVVQQQSEEPQRNYYTGLVYNPGQESGHSSSVLEQQSISVPAPGSDAFTQQQADYWTSVSQQQEAAAAGLGASSGVDTQYAADGGYVY